MPDTRSNVRFTHSSVFVAFTVIVLTLGTIVAVSSATINLAIINQNNSSVALAWTQSGLPLGTRYEVSVGSTGHSAWQPAGHAMNTMLTDLPERRAMTFQVRGKASGAWVYSNIARVRPGLPTIPDSSRPTLADIPAPTAPSNLKAVRISGTQVSLSWTDNSDTETNFNVERALAATGPFKPVGTPQANSTSFIDSNVTTSATLYYRVSASNAVGQSGFAGPVSISVPTAPNAPTGLVATATSSSQINLSWTDASNDETSFKVERSTSATGPFVAVTSSLPADTSSYSDMGLSASTVYYYRVSAENPAGSVPSTVASSTTFAAAPPPSPPSTPTSLSATANSSDTVRLAWTDTSSNESGFKVFRAKSVTGPFEVTGTAEANTTSIDDMNLTASTKYYYKVCAYNNGGDSNLAGPKSVTTQAPAVEAPTSAFAHPVSSNRVRFTWNDNSSTELAFRVYRTTVATATRTEMIVNAGITEYWDTTATADTDYRYEVCAIGPSGDSTFATSLCRTPRAISVQWLGDVPGIGDVTNVAMSAGRCFAVSPLGLHIIDTANPAKPIIKRTINIAHITAVAADPDSSKVCVAADSSIFVVDIDEDTVESFVVGINAPGLRIRNGYLYVARSSMGVAVYDLNNHQSPSMSAPTQYMANAVDVTNNWIVVADGFAGITVLNRSNGAIVSSYSTSDSATDVRVSGNYVYAACGQQGMVRLSLGANGSLTYAGRILTDGYVRSLDIEGSNIYAIKEHAARPSGNGLQLIQILPNDTMEAGPVFTPSSSTLRCSVSCKNGLVSVADWDGGLLFINTVNLFAPVEISRLTALKSDTKLAVAGSYLYASCGKSAYIYDTTNPAQTTHVSTINGSADVTAMTVDDSGSLLYIAYGNVGRVFSITDKTSPVEINSGSLPAACKNACYANSIVYGACGSAGLIAMNINSPNNYFQAPVGVGVVKDARAVSVRGNLAAVANGNNGLLLYNITAPASPAFISQVSISGEATDVKLTVDDLNHTLATVSTLTGGLKVVDVTNAALPGVITSFSTRSAAYGLAIVDKYALVANYNFGSDSGLQAVSLRDGNYPWEAMFVSETQGTPKSLAVSGSSVFMSRGKEPIVIGTVNY